MTIRFVCDNDACRSTAPYDAALPSGWRRLDEGKHACCGACEERVRHPNVVALKPRGAMSIEESFGVAASSPFLGSLLGSLAGSVLRDLRPSGWARPIRGEACHYFVNSDSVCGGWKGWRGAVQVKPTLKNVCKMCKAKETKRDRTRP